MPELLPITWVRTGQTASRIGNPSERCQIMAVTEVTHYRDWFTYGNTSELGDRRQDTHQDFRERWVPYYNSGQTRPGCRYLYVPSRSTYLVLRDESTQFIVHEATDQYRIEVVLNRLGLDPAEWLYIGPPAAFRGSDSQVISTSRPLRSPSSSDLTPKSRFDRDDIL